MRSQTSVVAALVRGASTVAATARLRAALARAEQDAGCAAHPSTADIQAIRSDILQPLCGVAPETVARLAREGEFTFWHLAADLRYERAHDEAIHASNVGGARNALALAVAVKARRFVHVSTAYVCGRETGLIEERVIRPSAGFNNSYEASKASAEQQLIDACAAVGMPLTILRPSIVIGPRDTRRAEGSGSGLNGLIRSMRGLTRSRSRQPSMVRVPACPAVELNLIPVDCVVDDMRSLARSDFPEPAVRHLTAGRGITVDQCWHAIATRLGIEDMVLAPPGSFEPTARERAVASRIAFFLDYVRVDRRFARSLAPDWAVSRGEVAEHVDNAVSAMSATSS